MVAVMLPSGVVCLWCKYLVKLAKIVWTEWCFLLTLPFFNSHLKKAKACSVCRSAVPNILPCCPHSLKGTPGDKGGKWLCSWQRAQHACCASPGKHILRRGYQCRKVTLSDWCHCNSAGPPNGPHNVIHPNRTQSPGNTLIDSSRRHSSASAQADLSIIGILIW